VTPNKCNLFLVNGTLDKYLSIIETATYNVSDYNLNFLCTSITHSTKNPLEVSFISFCTFGRY
jgi:hypothetical protein